MAPQSCSVCCYLGQSPARGRCHRPSSDMSPTTLSSYEHADQVRTPRKSMERNTHLNIGTEGTSMAQRQIAESEWARNAINMPWAAVNQLKRKAAWPILRLLITLHGVQCGHGCQLYGKPIIQRYRGSSIVIGDQVHLRSWRASNPLPPYHPVVLATRSAVARIEIGDLTGITGAAIVSSVRISIGKNVAIGANALIVDTDFHHLSPEARFLDPRGAVASPVVIHDDVFIGMNSIILKGVCIGAGTVIGAGSVVFQDLPSRVIAAGNPARVIRRL